MKLQSARNLAFSGLQLRLENHPLFRVFKQEITDSAVAISQLGNLGSDKAGEEIVDIVRTASGENLV